MAISPRSGAYGAERNLLLSASKGLCCKNRRTLVPREVTQARCGTFSRGEHISRKWHDTKTAKSPWRLMAFRVSWRTVLGQRGVAPFISALFQLYNGAARRLVGEQRTAVVIIAPNGNGEGSMRRGGGSDGPVLTRPHLTTMANPCAAINGKDWHILAAQASSVDVERGSQ